MKKTTLTIECAWHTKFFGKPLIMGTKDGKGQTGVTSSMCPDCWSKMFPVTEYPKEDEVE